MWELSILRQKYRAVLSCCVTCRSESEQHWSVRLTANQIITGCSRADASLCVNYFLHTWTSAALTIPRGQHTCSTTDKDTLWILHKSYLGHGSHHEFSTLQRHSLCLLLTHCKSSLASRDFRVALLQVPDCEMSKWMYQWQQESFRRRNDCGGVIVAFYCCEYLDLGLLSRRCERANGLWI